MSATDQFASSASTLVADTQLTVAIGASDTWVIHWAIHFTYPNGGIQIGMFQIPTGATWSLQAAGFLDNNSPVATTPAASFYQNDLTTTPGTGAGFTFSFASGSDCVVFMTATVKGDGTHAGTLGFGFCQGTISGTPATLKARSSVSAIKH